MFVHPHPSSSAKSKRMIAVAVATIAFAITLACSNKSSLSNAPQANANSGAIIGAGSTFIYPAMTRWISAFQSSHPGVRINYHSIASGGGIQKLKKGVVDFGASDAALDDTQFPEMPTIVQL